MQYKIEQIAGIIKAERHGNTSADISWLLTDSRSLCFPEETLFFAIKTKRNDGHRYISELYKNGVRNFVVSELPDDMPNCTDANFLVVSDTLQALQQLAEHHRMRFDIPVIAITGSNGKTTVKEWLYQLLSPSCNVCRSSSISFSSICMALPKLVSWAAMYDCASSPSLIFSWGLKPTMRVGGRKVYSCESHAAGA